MEFQYCNVIYLQNYQYCKREKSYMYMYAFGHSTPFKKSNATRL